MRKECSVLQIQIVIGVVLLIGFLLVKKYSPSLFEDLQAEYKQYIFADEIQEQEPVRFVMSETWKEPPQNCN